MLGAKAICPLRLDHRFGEQQFIILVAFCITMSYLGFLNTSRLQVNTMMSKIISVGGGDVATVNIGGADPLSLGGPSPLKL